MQTIVAFEGTATETSRAIAPLAVALLSSAALGFASWTGRDCLLGALKHQLAELEAGARRRRPLDSPSL